MTDTTTGRAPEEGRVLRFEPYRYDRDSGILYRDGDPMSVQPKVLELLECLLERAGDVVSKDDLLDRVWNDAVVTEHSLTESVRRLREALDDDPSDPSFVQTVRGRGYRFIAPVSVEAGGDGARTRGAVRPGRGEPGALDAMSRWERPILRGMVLLLALGLVAAGAALWSRSVGPPASPGGTRVEMALPRPLASPNFEAAVDISPGGERIVWVAKTGEGTRLYLKRIDQFESVPLPGTEGASLPMFSPDGRSVAFFAGGELKKLSLEGGAPVTLSTARDLRHASWEADGNIYFSRPPPSGLYRVSAEGGEPRQVTTLDRAAGELSHRYPQLLPDGETLLFGTWPVSKIVLVSLDSGERQTLLEGSGFARYVPTGHLVFGSGGRIRARPFDPSSLRLGTPETRLTGIGAYFRFSRNGTLVFAPPQVLRSAAWVDRNGEVESLPPSGSLIGLSLSPDGQAMLLNTYRGIYRLDLRRGTNSRLSLPEETFAPVWAPDGERFTFSARGEDGWRIGLAPGDGGTESEPLLESPHPIYPHSFSPDGRSLAFMKEDPDTGRDIWVLPLNGDREPRPFVRSPHDETAAVFSPDGRWIAYSSDESGQEEVYVRSYPGPDPKVQVSAGGGRSPAWSPDGGELFYLTRSATESSEGMMVVEVDYEPELTLTRPRRVFELEQRILGSGITRTLDMAPDGERFALILFENRQAEQLNVIFDWFDALEEATAPSP